MTLEEAIKHAEETAEKMLKKCNTEKCGFEHLQLANWLKELKTRREADFEKCGD